jgi:hypothetical protein
MTPNQRIDIQKKAIALHDREAITARCIKQWEDANRHYTHCLQNGVAEGIVEDARQNAIDHYEAMLDAIYCERGALLLLEAAQKAASVSSTRPPSRGSSGAPGKPNPLDEKKKKPPENPGGSGPLGPYGPFA